MYNFQLNGKKIEAANLTVAESKAVKMLEGAANGSKVVIEGPSGQVNAVTKSDGCDHWNHPGFKFSA